MIPAVDRLIDRFHPREQREMFDFWRLVAPRMELCKRTWGLWRHQGYNRAGDCFGIARPWAMPDLRQHSGSWPDRHILQICVAQPDHHQGNAGVAAKYCLEQTGAELRCTTSVGIPFLNIKKKPIYLLLLGNLRRLLGQISGKV